MIGMRKFAGFLMALAFAAFALPAAADSDDKFSLALSPLAPAAQAGPITFIATIKNLAKYDYVKSFAITVPGYTISGTTTSSAGTVSVAGQVVSVSGVKIATNKTVQVTIQASSTPACGTNPASIWTATAKGGLFVNNEVFNLDSATAPRTTTITPLCYTVSGSTSDGGTITCTPTLVAVGASSACTLATSPGWTFASFSGNCTPTATGCTVSNVTSNQQVTATFTQIQYPVTGAAAPAVGGTMICSPAAVTYNGSSTCTAAPSAGYSFNRNTGFSAGCAALNATQCKVSGVQSPQTVTATFTQIPYNVTGSVPAGGGSLTCVSPVFYGVDTTCTAAANPNYSLTGFSNNCPPTAQGSLICKVSSVIADTSVTATFAANTLTIGSPQTSAAVGADYAVTVQVVGPATTVTLIPVGCPAITGSLSADGSSGQASFSLKFGAVSAVGACTLKATASNYNPSAALPITVFAVGNLGCAGVTGSPDSTINGSAPGVTSISQPGFAEGIRGKNVKGDPTKCDPINFTFTNNVLGGNSAVDPNGNTVPVNGVSFLWDQVVPMGAAYSYTVTWLPEWFGLNVAANRITKFCGDVACTVQVPAQICLDPGLFTSSLPPSVPFTGWTPPISGKDPVCISAEVWGVVPSAQCPSTGPNAAKPGQTACVVVTTTITDIGDPPFVRN